MEYVIIAAMIAATLVATVQFFGSTVLDQFDVATTAMVGQSSGAGGGQPSAPGADNDEPWDPGTGNTTVDINVFETNEREWGSNRTYERNEDGGWDLVSSSTEETHWGETVSETRTGDAEEDDRSWVDRNVDVTVTIAEAELEHLDVEGSVAGVEYQSENVRAAADVLGYETDVDAALNIGEDGIQGELSAEAQAYLMRAQLEAEFGPGFANAEAAILAEAQAGVDVSLNPFGGDVGVSGGVEAFAGGKAEVEGGVQGDVGSIGGNAGVSYGIGAELQGELGLEDGVVRASLDVGVTLGVGVDLGVEIEVDFVELGQDVIELGEDAIELAEDAIEATRIVAEPLLYEMFRLFPQRFTPGIPWYGFD